MQDRNFEVERHNTLFDAIIELRSVNEKLADLVAKKEELTDLIIGALGHEHEGQKSYEFETWKVEVKTPCIYSLDKKAFAELPHSLPPEFYPIEVSTSYTVNRKIFDHAMNKADDDIKNILVGLITKKPGKPSVNIKDRV